MSIIQKVQKETLIEEASRTALKRSRPDEVFDIYRSLIGVSDYDVQAIFGLPMAAGYKAIPGKEIDVEKIRNYIQGIFRDLQVSIDAVNQLEDEFAMTIGDFWYDIENLKGQAQDIINSAAVEHQRLNGDTSWTFTETFKNVFYVDNSLTDAWIDTGEGMVFLPMSDDHPVTSEEITILSVDFPDPGGMLGSTPIQAFDSLESTNWRLLVTRPGTKAVIEIAFKNPVNVSSVTFDPVGFGVDTLVEVLTDKAYQVYTKQIFYSRTTVPIPAIQARRFRFTLSTPESSLPKTIGFKDIVFHRANPVKSARLITKAIRPTFSFNSLQIVDQVDLPPLTQVDIYYSLDQNLWRRIVPNSWTSVVDDNTQKIAFNLIDLTSYGILFQTPLFPAIPTSNNEGQLEVGDQQLEVSAVRLVSAEQGDLQHNPGPSDFSTAFVRKAWADMKQIAHSEAGSAAGLGLQLESDNTAHTVLQRDVRMVAPQDIGETYQAMTLLPMGGTATTRSMQPNYVYRLRYNVFLNEDKYFESGRFWFLQGFRTAGQRTYSQVGETFGAFSLYINGVKITGSDQPRTLYSDGTYESGTATGESYSFTLNKGWNVVELYVYTPEIPRINVDPYTTSDPYLQLTLYPNIFDAKFCADYGVTKILGSGTFRPIPEFDLMWHVPKDPQFWAWPTLEDSTSILLNVGSVAPIDGWYGLNNSTLVSPQCVLTYLGYTNDQHGGQNSSVDVYLRFDLSRSDKSIATPVLRGYTLTTK